MTVKKKPVCLFLVLSLLLSAVSCAAPKQTPPEQPPASPTVAETPFPSQETYSLKPYVPAYSEKELLSLLFCGEKTYLFSFTVPDTIDKVRVWHDVYKKGKLTEHGSPTECEIDKYVGSGKIAVVISGDTIRTSAECAFSSTLTVEEIPKANRDYAGSFWQDSAGTAADNVIAPGTEIALAVYAVNREDSGLGSPEFYVQNPDAMAKFDCMYIFKCSFSGA